MRQTVLILFLVIGCCMIVAAQQENIELQLVNKNKISLPPGVTTNLAIRLVNNSKEDELVSLKLNLPKGWKCFSELKLISTPKSSPIIKILSLNIPFKTPAGNYSITINAYDNQGRNIGFLEWAVLIELKYALRVELIDGPEYVFSGDTLSVQFMVQNLSNSNAEIVGVVNGISKNDKLSFSLNPDSSTLITRKIIADSEILKSIKKNINISVSVKGMPDVKATNAFGYNIIPLRESKFDSYRRFPIKFSTSFVSDNQRGRPEYALIAEITGKSFLDEKHTKILSFIMRGPDRRGQPLYGIYDEYLMEYITPKSSYLLGDNNYQLSYLTEFIRYGRGGQTEHNYNHFKIGSFIEFPRFFPTIKRVAAAYIGYSLNDKVIFNIGYLNKLRSNGMVNNLMTFNGKGSLFNWANIDWEYAIGTIGTDYKQALKAQLNINFNWLNLFYHYTLSEKDFPGFFNDTRNMIAYAGINISKNISVSANYNSSHQNIAMDTIYSSAPFSTTMTFYLNYNLSKSGRLSASYNDRKMQDNMEPMLFDNSVHTLKLNISKRFENFGFDIEGEYGKTENFLLPESERLNSLYRGQLSTNYKPTKKLSFNGFVSYQKNFLYRINDQKNWVYGISVNGSVSKKFSLFINYQNIYNYEEYYRDRSIIDGKLIYFPNNNNRFEISSRYHIAKNSMNVKQLTTEVKYIHTFNIPVSKKKNLGKLNGRVINKGVKTIEGIILSTGSSQAVTDKNGNYCFPMLPAGSYYLMIDYSKAGIFAVPETPGPYQLEILPGIENRFDIGLTESAKITGEVSILKEVSDEDKSYAGIRDRLGKLLVEAKNGSEVYRNFTKEDGRFAFESLRPGQWSVRVYQAGIPKEYELVTDQFNVGLASGQSEHLEVKVKEVRRKIKFQTLINTTPPSANQPAKTGAPSGKTGASNGTSKSKPISKSVTKPQGKPIVSDTSRIKSKSVSFNFNDPKGTSGNIEYRIQLGSYDRPLASTDALAAKLHITGKIIREDRYNGHYIYTIGSYKSQREATVRNEVIKKSTTTIIPFVVSFRNGVRTPKMEKTQLAVK